MEGTLQKIVLCGSEYVSRNPVQDTPDRRHVIS